MNGRKDDQDKADLSLLPPAALESVGQVLTWGAKKYEAENWRRVPGWRRRYLAAGLRHVFSYMRGKKSDPESKLPHLAHAACCFLFLLELEELDACQFCAAVEGCVHR
jgi:hypothetical protein